MRYPQRSLRTSCRVSRLPGTGIRALIEAPEQALGPLDPRRRGRGDCCALLIALCNTHRLENPMASHHAAAREYVLTLSCRDTPGIVYAVSSFVVQQGGNISQSQQFDDRLGDQFFMRVQFTVANDDLAELREGFAR